MTEIKAEMKVGKVVLVGFDEGMLVPQCSDGERYNQSDSLHFLEGVRTSPHRIHIILVGVC